MNSATLNKVTQLQLDGPIGLPLAAALIILLLSLFVWSLHREHHLLQRYAWLFGILRATAAATVVWMLLAPTQVTTEISSQRQSIAVVMDVSDSMQTVDPAGTADERRWMKASGPASSEFDQQILFDRALASVSFAIRHLQAAGTAVRNHAAEQQITARLAGARNAIERCLARLVELQSISGQASNQSGLSEDIAGLLRRLRSDEFNNFADLSRRLERGRQPAERDWRESLPDLLDRLRSVRHSLTQLSLMADHAGVSPARKTPAGWSNTSRLARVHQLVRNLHQTVLSTVSESADVVYHVFDQKMHRTAAPATDLSDNSHAVASTQSEDADESGDSVSHTNLSDVLTQLNRNRSEQSLAAAVVFTDAAHNDPDSDHPRKVLTGLNELPVYMVPIGNTRHVRDVVIQSVASPAVAMRNDEVVIEATVQSWECANESSVVRLLQHGQEVDSQPIEFASSFEQRTVRFRRRLEEVGPQHFQLRIEPLVDELTNRNNEQNFEVNVTRSDIRVLLADEVPRWEYRYLSQLFRRDPNIQCDEMLFEPALRATGQRQATKSLPQTADEWNFYDVVILGDLSPSHFSEASRRSLQEYLAERAGNLIVIAGHDFMPHAFADDSFTNLLPVTEQSFEPDDQSVQQNQSGYSFQVTADGLLQDALMIGETAEASAIAWEFVNQHSPIYQLSSWNHARPGARTLINAVPRGGPANDQHPALLSWQPVGSGLCIYLAAPDTWRLRLLRGDRLHYRFWGQLLRWAIAQQLAAGSDGIRLRTDRGRYTQGETVHVQALLSDGQGHPVVGDKVHVTAQSETSSDRFPLRAESDVPGRYTAELPDLNPGEYVLSLEGHPLDASNNNTNEGTQNPAGDATKISFLVQPYLPVEVIDTRADLALAQQIADATGGQVLPPTAVAEAISLLDLSPEVTTEVRTKPLWLQWKYLWLVVGCLHTEWIIRKWKGLS